MNLFKLKSEVSDRRLRLKRERATFLTSMKQTKQAAHDKATSTSALASSFAIGALTGWVANRPSKAGSHTHYCEFENDRSKNQTETATQKSHAGGNTMVLGVLAQLSTAGVGIITTEASRIAASYLQNIDWSNPASNSNTTTTKTNKTDKQTQGQHAEP